MLSPVAIAPLAIDDRQDQLAHILIAPAGLHAACGDRDERSVPVAGLAVGRRHGLAQQRPHRWGYQPAAAPSSTRSRAVGTMAVALVTVPARRPTPAPRPLPPAHGSTTCGSAFTRETKLRKS